MKKIFLDTNILIDFVLGRDNGEAKRLLQLGCDKKVCLAINENSVVKIDGDKILVFGEYKVINNN